MVDYLVFFFAVFVTLGALGLRYLQARSLVHFSTAEKVGPGYWGSYADQVYEASPTIALPPSERVHCAGCHRDSECQHPFH